MLSLMRTSGICRSMILIALVLVCGRAAHANSFGVTSLLFRSGGCNECHAGGQTPTVQLTGPTMVTAGATNEYTLQISAVGSQNKGGLNVSTTAGVLAVGGADAVNTQAVTGAAGRKEITHTAPKAAVDGVVTFTFLWTAPTPFSSATLTAWGNAVNGDAFNSGDRAASTTLTITADVSVATPTPTPTMIPTPTATATLGAPACVGDCNGDGTVTINEIITGVNIALDVSPMSACPPFDKNDDGTVTIDELLAAVNAAVGSCPQ